MPIETPSDGLDLAALREADAALDAAAARLRAAAIRDRLAPALEELPPGMRAALEGLIDEIGRASAEAGAARQAAEGERRSRGDWLQIDPLRHIPEERGAAPPAPPSSVSVLADDPGFVGFGWHAPEGPPGGARRWSGGAAAASVILPGVGAGVVEITLEIDLPFGVRLRPEALTLLLNGEPLDPVPEWVEGSGGTLTATWDATDAAGANLGLVLLGPLSDDPLGRDTRRLGPGLRRAAARLISRGR